MRVISQVWWTGSSATDSWGGDVALHCSSPSLYPHPPLWGVHTFPAFLECCLSAPSSAKETLTAINYHAGWTKGIPLCWNIGVHTRSHTDRCSTAYYIHTHTHIYGETPPGLHWSSSCLTNESKCFVLWGCPITMVQCLLWVDRAGRGGDVMTRQLTRTLEKPGTHTFTHIHAQCWLRAGCMCAAPIFMRWFYDYLCRYWLGWKACWGF